MCVVTFFQSTRGQVVSVLAGFALIGYGAVHVSLAGLVLMMVGTVPAVIGLGDICFPREVARTRGGTESHGGGTAGGRARRA